MNRLLDLYIFKYKTFNIEDVPLNILNDNLLNCKKLIHYYSWVKLREILLKHNIDIYNMPIRYNENGKPLIDIPYYFNISHSKDLIAITISDFLCGVDIEYVNRTRNIKKLSKYVFKEEIADIDSFYINWVRMEATVKLNGDSILKNDNSYLDCYYNKIEDKNNLYYYAVASNDKNIVIHNEI